MTESKEIERLIQAGTKAGRHIGRHTSDKKINWADVGRQAWQ